MGGAIDFEGANGTIIGSNFTNNHAYGGGAIYVGALTGYTNITGATFTNNGAVNYGGAINLIASSVTVNESNFYDNYAVRGGALYVGGDGHTNYIYSSLFKGNKAISDKTLQVILLNLNLSITVLIMVVEYTSVEDHMKAKLKDVTSLITKLNIMVVQLTVMHPKCI